MQIRWDLPGEGRSLRWLTEKEAQPAKGWLQVNQKVERDERLLFLFYFFPPKDHTLPPEPTWMREKDALVSDKTFIRDLALFGISLYILVSEDTLLPGEPRDKQQPRSYVQH